MPEAFVELDPPGTGAPGFGGDTSDLVYFLSLAYAARFGASHDLATAANILRTDFGIDLRPLLTFADRYVEEEVDARALEHAWQDPAHLADCCEAVIRAFDSGDERLAAALSDFPRLRDRVSDLAAISRWAAERGARVRITYSMDERP